MTRQKEEKHSNGEYKMNTRQVWPSCLGILPNTILDQEEQKGRPEHAKIHLDTRGVLEECFME